MATTTRAKHSKFDRVAINQGLTVVHPDPDQPRRVSSDEIAVDIIAVPGLGASPEWTWRSKNKVDWLRDSNMLPRVVTDARIMVFEYESQWFGKGSINQRLSNVADQLVQALFHQRSKGLKRPIVFVCHCLGGIIVEKAILAAQLRQNDYPNIFMSVVGCIFLGTPFRGTKSQAKASLLAEMAQSVGLGFNSGLLKLLEEGSEMLKDLLSDFSSLARDVNMQIFCFFEQHESDVMNLAIRTSHLKHKELIVEEESAHIDGYRTGALASDHFGLNKFTGPKDGRYISVAGEINAAVQRASGILKSRQNAMRQSLIDDATYQTILDDLKATDPQKDLQDSVKGRSASQALWALENDSYVKWKTTTTSNVLWIHGPAGTGQPVIAHSLIHDLERTAQTGDGNFLAYFFCDEKDSHRRNIRDVLNLLIRQMIWKNRDLTEHLLVDEEKGKAGSRRSQNLDMIPLTELWRRLQSIFTDSLVEKVYIVVNAFDETDGESRKEFLQLFEPSLEPRSETAGTGEETSVKWIFLSRTGRPDIEKSFSKGLVICTVDKENAGFVNAGVKREISGQIDQLAKLKNLNDALTYLIKRYLYQKAEGNYIYAQLVVQELKNLEPWQVNISTIRRFLEDLPFGLTDMFDFICKRVLNPQSEGIEYTKEILRCLTLALESPSLSELALIADLPTGVRDDDEAIKNYVRRCGAFLTVSEDDDGNEIVEWIDIVAKEHLNTYAKDELSLALSDVQHGIVALRCLQHVRSCFTVKPEGRSDLEINPNGQNTDISPVTEDTEADSVHVPNPDDQKSDADANQNDAPESPLKNHVDHDSVTDGPVEETEPRDDLQVDKTIDNSPADEAEGPAASDDGESYLDYAVNHWIEHAMQAPEDIVEEFDLSDEFWSQDSKSRAAWWEAQQFETRYPGVTGLMPLHLAALTGYSALVDHLLKNGRSDELQQMDSWGLTPFTWACDHGDIRLVDRLMKAGGEINKASDSWGPTGLWAAACRGHLDVVHYLLEHDAEVNVQNAGDGSPLYIAAEKCNSDIVLELLQHGADVNIKSGWHVRALNVAAYSGFADIVQLLLDHGAEIDPNDDYRYGSALGAATRRGHTDIVRSLLKKGWDVNRKLQGYGSFLVAGATYGHAEAVRALLEHNVNAMSQVQALEVASKNGRTEVVKHLLEKSPFLPCQKAFHNAASYGRDDVLELFEGRGPTPEMLKDALYHSSDQERESTVNLLLNLGADPDAEGKEYGTALQAAAYDGTKGIVESLLAHKADVNKQGGDFGTALQAAALNGHQDIVQMLLDHGAQVNVGTIGRYGSALQAACWSGNSDLVELLITHGADVNSSGGIYGSPIMAAVDESMTISLEILVKHGANVNVKDIRDQKPTVLVQAGYTLGKESLELLIDHGADIEGTDDEGVSVLISVADSGDKESLQMLIERGANIHAVSKPLGTALSAAASEGDEECCKVLLDHGANPNQESGDWGTALQAAADAADLDCVNLLLEAGANVNQIGAGYGCALQAAAHSGDVACLQRLLESGADVNTIGGEFGYPLQAAAIMGHHECLQILLDHGADINLEGGIYSSALQAAAARRDNQECVKTLLDRGANVHSNGGLFGSIAQAAAVGGNFDLWDMLLERGMDVHVQGGKYGTVLQAAALNSGVGFVQRVLDQTAEVNDVSGKYGTPLQAAAFANNPEVTTLLLEHNANPQLEGGLYGNALNAAASRGNIEVLRLLLDQALPVEMLGEALIQAVYRRRDTAVEMLLKKGASVEARDELLGSVQEALQKEAPEESNSDDEHSDDEDGDDNEEASDDESADGQDEDEGDDNDTDSVTSKGGTDDQKSIADVSIENEDSTSIESKIQKLLDDAITKIKRKPSLRRPATVKRKPVSQYHQYHQNGRPATSTGAYQPFGDRWRVAQSQLAPPDSTSAYGQAQPSTPATGEYAAYSTRPQVPQPYSPYQQQSHPGILDNQEVNDPSRPQPFLSENQFGFPSGGQQPPPIPPKANIYSYNDLASGVSMPPTTSYQSQHINTTKPPPMPPRQSANNYNENEPYVSSTHSTPYQTQQQPYQPQQPYTGNNTPPQFNTAYAPYKPPTQSPPTNSGASTPPRPPPRPAPSPNQSTDTLDFTRLQEKANKFSASVGKFWK